MTDGQSRPPEAEPLRPRHVQRDEHTRNGCLATHHSSVGRTPEWPRVPLRAHERSGGGLLSHPFRKGGPRGRARRCRKLLELGPLVVRLYQTRGFPPQAAWAAVVRRKTARNWLRDERICNGKEHDLPLVR